MKQFGILALGLGLALMTACSKDNDEPITPQEKETMEETVAEWSGKFDGRWTYLGNPINGTMDVEEEGIVFQTFPAKAIFSELVQAVQTGAIDRPIRQEHLTDTIGNIFYADSYNYKTTNQYVTFKLVTASDGSCHASDITLYNAWSNASLFINVDKEPPYTGETFEIKPIGPNTIAFAVEADGVPYLVTLNNIEKELSLDFDASTGLWTFNYWFSSFRIFNMDDGKEYSVRLKYTGPEKENKQDTINLQFKATQRTGPSDGIGILDELIIYY